MCGILDSVPYLFFSTAYFLVTAWPCNGMGNDPFVDAAESASFPLPGTGPFFSGRIFLFIYNVVKALLD